jgi:selenide, water dikinase
VRTGGDARNREYVAGHLDSGASAAVEAICLDPQTSGGLLACVDPATADGLRAAGFWNVGTIEAGRPAVVIR